MRTPGITDTADLTGPLYDFTDVLSALRVCYQWYRVATSTSTLWTFIDFAYDRNALVKLRRTQKAPLHIRFSLDKYATSVLVDLMRSHGDRVRELHLWAKDSTSLTRLPGQLNVLADRLESVVMAGAQRGGVVTIRSLFLGQTPVLKSLAVRRVPWVPSNTFPNLTHLYLSRLPLFPIAIFLGLLERTRRLQLLHVDECAIDISGFDGRRTTVVSLPHLRNMSLGHLALDPLPHVLSHLDLPAHVMLRLYSLRFWQQGEDDFDTLVLPNPFTISNYFTRLEIIVGENWRKLVAESEQPGRGGFWIEFISIFATPPSCEDWEEWLLRVPQMVSLANVETLRLSIRFWEILPDLAHHMPRVKYLAVEEYARLPPDLLEYAVLHCLAGLLCKDDPVPLPNLESLYIDSSCDLPDPKLMLTAVHKRHRSKRRLRSLTIRVDPSRYTVDYITEQYAEVVNYVDELHFVSDEMWKWDVNEVWHASHNYWVLRPSEDPMRAMEYRLDEPMRVDD